MAAPAEALSVYGGGGGSAGTGCKHGLALLAPAGGCSGGSTLARGGQAEGGVRCQDDLHTAAPPQRTRSHPEQSSRGTDGCSEMLAGKSTMEAHASF